MYKAQTPNLETRGAPEVKEAQDVQVELPVDQVGCKHHTAVPPPPCLCSVSPCLPACCSSPTPPQALPGLWNGLGPLQLAIARPSDPMSHIFPSAHLSSHALLLPGPFLTLVIVCDCMFSSVILALLSLCSTKL